jgi:hypothetical protein
VIKETIISFVFLLLIEKDLSSVDGIYSRFVRRKSLSVRMVSLLFKFVNRNFVIFIAKFKVDYRENILYLLITFCNEPVADTRKIDKVEAVI